MNLAAAALGIAMVILAVYVYVTLGFLPAIMLSIGMGLAFIVATIVTFQGQPSQASNEKYSFNAREELHQVWESMQKRPSSTASSPSMVAEQFTLGIINIGGQPIYWKARKEDFEAFTKKDEKGNRFFDFNQFGTLLQPITKEEYNALKLQAHAEKDEFVISILKEMQSPIAQPAPSAPIPPPFSTTQPTTVTPAQPPPAIPTALPDQTKNGKVPKQTLQEIAESGEELFTIPVVCPKCNTRFNAQKRGKKIGDKIVGRMIAPGKVDDFGKFVFCCPNCMAEIPMQNKMKRNA